MMAETCTVTFLQVCRHSVKLMMTENTLSKYSSYMNMHLFPEHAHVCNKDIMKILHVIC